jgi:hypothetical protein
MSSPPHLLDLITLTIFCEEYRLWSSSLCNFLHDPSSSLLGPNILNTQFSETLSLCSSLKVRDQDSHPHRTAAKITAVYFSQPSLFETVSVTERKSGIEWNTSVSGLCWRCSCIGWKHEGHKEKTNFYS